MPSKMNNDTILASNNKNSNLNSPYHNYAISSITSSFL